MSVYNLAYQTCPKRIWVSQVAWGPSIFSLSNSIRNERKTSYNKEEGENKLNGWDLKIRGNMRDKILKKLLFFC